MGDPRFAKGLGNEEGEAAKPPGGGKKVSDCLGWSFNHWGGALVEQNLSGFIMFYSGFEVVMDFLTVLNGFLRGFPGFANQFFDAPLASRKAYLKAWCCL